MDATGAITKAATAAPISVERSVEVALTDITGLLVRILDARIRIYMIFFVLYAFSFLAQFVRSYSEVPSFHVDLKSLGPTRLVDT
jgi:hypothetical protein